MSLPDSTITLLQDEAYLHLCRRTIEEALRDIAAQKTDIESTRPPFGILATRSTREAFQSSMHTVLTSEAALRNRFGKINLLENALKSRLQRELHAYLERVSTDYRSSRRVIAVVDGWELVLPTYAEKLKAYARELREATTAVQRSVPPTRDTYERRMRAFAQLRFAAVSVDGAAGQLEALAQRLTQATGTLFAGISISEPPFIRQTEWTDRVIKLTDPEMITALSRVESAVRGMLADDLGVLRAQAETIRQRVGLTTHNYLEHYWSQLRTHALTHYVTESDVDDVISRLEERYIAADIQQRMNDLAEVADPYGFAR